MHILQSRSFARKVKRFNPSEKKILDREVRKIFEQPSLGQEKKGDLRGIRVHKFKIKSHQYLLAYRFQSKTLQLIMIGPHENYYRDLKNYLK